VNNNNWYDHYFQTYTAIHFGNLVHYHWLKAMGLAESNLDPEAVSPVGAVGVMQLMPKTSAWMAKELGIEDDRRCPHLNIRMGIAYARICWNLWQKESGEERIKFMCASYNAGPGNIAKAQSLAGKANLDTTRWDEVAKHLDRITGNRAEETINYVQRICKYKNLLTS
jgi:membrane-bound lytic murein transglycosylase F